MSAILLCYVTDRRSLSDAGGDSAGRRAALVRRIETAVRSGVDWIQIREKDLEGRELFHLTTEALRVCAEMSQEGQGARVIVNDRLDVAWPAHAAGVHLGESSLPVHEVAQWKERCGQAGFMVGASCHSREAAVEAAAGGADYLFFGPVFATPSKKAFGPPQGLAKLREVCRAVPIPVLAIGGITLDNAAACLEAGAAGIAAIRLFQQAQDVVEIARQLRHEK
jgi:thiamine-phosphate pyrophosphorylase